MKHLRLPAPSRLFAGIAVAAVVAVPCASQDLRYEIGLRIRAFEREFEPRIADVEVRSRVLGPLQKAVSSFFSLRLTEVAREVDGARRRLGASAPSPAVRWADSLSFRPSTRLLDDGATALDFKLLPLYAVEDERPEAASLCLRWRSPEQVLLGDAKTFDVGGLPLSGTVPIPPDATGDCQLVIELRAGATPLARHAQTISLVPDSAVRLERARELVREEPVDTRRATVRGLARLLRTLAARRTNESDVPATRVLARLEQLARAPAESEPAARPFGMHRPGDQRIWLRAGGKSVATRVFVPRVEAPAERRPLVLALHGAGGTENLFFEGYGAGKIVRLCEQRGWLLVAPRSGSFGSRPSAAGIVDALAALYPVDRSKVFAVGHSMGAMQTMAAVRADPALFAAVAALGGGGSARPSDALRTLPIFIGPGEKDFALRSAQRLRAALERAGATGVRYRAYEATEHLGIVQVALDDVFAFYDEVAGR